MSWVAAGAAAGAIGGALITSNATDKASGAQDAATRQAVGEQARQYDQSRADLAPYRAGGSAAVTRLQQLLGIGGNVDTNDPRYQAIYNGIRQQADEAHQQRYGISIFDPRSGYFAPGQKGANEEAWNKAATQQFTSQYGDQSSSVPGYGSLNNKFTLADFWSDPVTQASYQSGLDIGKQALDRSAGARGSRDSGAQLKALLRFGTDYTGQQAAGSQARFVGDQTNTFNRLSGVAGTGQTAAANTAATGAQTSGNIAQLLTAQGNARGAAAIAAGNAWGGAAQSIGNWYQQQQVLNRLFPRNASAGGGGSPSYGE